MFPHLLSETLRVTIQLCTKLNIFNVCIFLKMEGYKVGLCNMQGHFVFGETQCIYISKVISNFSY